MRTDWPFCARTHELAQIAELVTSRQCNGVVLAGEAGVGKSRLALEGLDHARRVGLATLRVLATGTARHIPFGAVATLLPAATPRPPADDRAAMIRQASAALLAGCGPGRLVLMVDDAHLLDDATATLVHQLCLSGSAFVLLTVRSGEPAPDAVVSLWKDGLAERMALSGLDEIAAEAMLRGALGGPVDRGLVGRLVTRTNGNIMFIRELVLGAVEDGSIRCDDGLWHQARPLSPSDQLIELVEARLATLVPQQRSVLELLAFGEPIGLPELELLTGRESAEDLERCGLITTEDPGHGLHARLAHPLYADVLRARTPYLHALSVTRTLAEAVERTGPLRQPDILRVATWRLACGGGSPELMLEAAHAARWKYDFDLAARLAGAALDAGAGFPARLLAVQIAILQGRGADVEGELDELARQARDDSERGAVELTRLDNVAFNLADIDKGIRLAEAAEHDITDTRWKDEVRARRASLLLVVPNGGPRVAAATAEPLLHKATGSAKVWAHFTASCSLTRMGRMTEALHWSDEGYHEHLRLERALEWYPWIHAYSRGEALSQLGRLREATALALREYETGIAEGSPERQAFFAWQSATRVAEQGGARAAVDRCREARGLFEQLGRPFFVRHCLVHLALGLALAGRPHEAVTTLGDLDSMRLPARFFAYSGDLLQARAWTAAAFDDLTAARAHLHEGVGLGAATGDIIGEATALHSLARLGRAKHVAGRLSSLADRIEGDLFTARAAHAQALAHGNPDQLRDVSVVFENMGAMLLAAEAAAAEAAARSRAGESREATAARRRAGVLADECDGATTPILRQLGNATNLTHAELRVARRAGNGVSNKDIAREFQLSVRTVEHQLQSVYGKLGITRRSELSQALTEVG
jgi:DNA-binding CsgD family transcriptional regulator